MSSQPRPLKVLVLSTIVVFTVLAFSQSAYAGSGKFNNGKFDFCISVRFNATPAQLDRIKTVFDQASFVLFDATDAHHQFGTITIVNNSGAGEAADYWIDPGSGTAHAPLGMFGVWGQHAMMFYNTDFVDINKTGIYSHTVIHEFGHLAYRLYDEYKGPGFLNITSTAAECAPPGSDTPTLNYCIMDAFAHRGLALTSPLEVSLNEFCSASDHDRAAPGNPGSANNTYQQYYNGKSCWETIASHPKWSIPAPDPPMETGGSATPATFQSGSPERRFMLLIDRSGSMADDSKMTFAKLAANQFITYAPDGMGIGVASFADSGELNFFLTPINESNRPQAFSAVNALQAFGATNIGHGLQIALAEIEAQTENCCDKAILLISDGDHNVGTPPDAVIPALVAARVSVFTIGIGSAISASGEATLQNLSRQTGGRYYRVNNSSLINFQILNILFNDALAGGPALQAPTFITTGQVIEVPVNVDQGAARAAFLVGKVNSADVITLSLRKPSGQIVTANDGSGGNPNIRYREDAFTRGFQIFSPEPGTWTMVITAGSIFNGNLNVRALVEHEGSRLTAFVTNELATYPQPFRVIATPEWEGRRVLGATVTGKVIHPQGMSVPFTLFDDGALEHGDDVPGDGIYSANFNYVDQFGPQYRNGAPIAGSYTIELTTTNTNGTMYPGEVELYPDPPPSPVPVPPFTRLTSTTAIVANVPTDTIAPSCQATNCNPGPPASCDLTVQDTGVGLSLINVISTNNVNVTIPSFAAATTAPVIVTGTLINPNSNGSFEIQSVDMFGNSSSCSRTIDVSSVPPPIFADDFNDNSLDTSRWTPNDLFSGFIDLSLPLSETGQRLEIGPLLQNASGSHYRGIRTLNTNDFTGAYSHVELVQPASAATKADAMFTVGYDVNNYYRIYVSEGNLIGLKKIGGVKTTLFTLSYNATNHRYLGIRHDAATNSVVLETAPSTGTGPGSWTQRYSEGWNSAVQLSATLFELKGGTSQPETNPPGKVIFDNFAFGLNSATSSLTVTSVCPTSGSSGGGTPVLIRGAGFQTNVTVRFGGVLATSVQVTSASTLVASTPAHAVGAVNVSVTNVGGQSATLTNGYTYTSPPAAGVVLEENFNDNCLNTLVWTPDNLFSGFIDLSLPIFETAQRLEIGPLLLNTSDSHYRGIRTINRYDFTGAYSYVELVQPASAATKADAMFTVGYDVDNYYRIYVSEGNLIGIKKIGGVKTTFFTLSYDATNHRYLRIRHNATTNSVVLETAPSTGTGPGNWTQRYSEGWNSAVPLSAILFELKAGTWQAETNAPGKAIFDSFLFAR